MDTGPEMTIVHEFLGLVNCRSSSNYNNLARPCRRNSAGWWTIHDLERRNGMVRWYGSRVVTYVWQMIHGPVSWFLIGLDFGSTEYIVVI